MFYAQHMNLTITESSIQADQPMVAQGSGRQGVNQDHVETPAPTPEIPKKGQEVKEQQNAKEQLEVVANEDAEVHQSQNRMGNVKQVSRGGPTQQPVVRMVPPPCTPPMIGVVLPGSPLSGLDAVPTTPPGLPAELPSMLPGSPPPETNSTSSSTPSPSAPASPSPSNTDNAPALALAEEGGLQQWKALDQESKRRRL
jgi:hypothetical protein